MAAFLAATPGVGEVTALLEQPAQVVGRFGAAAFVAATVGGFGAGEVAAPGWRSALIDDLKPTQRHITVNG